MTSSTIYQAAVEATRARLDAVDRIAGEAFPTELEEGLEQAVFCLLVDVATRYAEIIERSAWPAGWAQDQVNGNRIADVLQPLEENLEMTVEDPAYQPGRGVVRPAPKVGDLAWHVDGHDPRPVTRVEDGSIWIGLPGGSECGPVPASNYTFSTPIADKLAAELAGGADVDDADLDG